MSFIVEGNVAHSPHSVAAVGKFAHQGARGGSHSGQGAPPACTSVAGGGELGTGPVPSLALAEALSFSILRGLQEIMGKQSHLFAGVFLLCLCSCLSIQHSLGLC